MCVSENRRILRMGRSPCCSKEDGVHRGAWTEEEDGILTQYVAVHGEGRWRTVPKKAGLKRCGKSCRLRWLNYLRPDIKRGNISDAEEELIIRMHKLLGNRWSLIAGRLPGRTDNEIKNYWNTNLSKKLMINSSSQTTTTAPNKPTKQRKPRPVHRTKITKPSYNTTTKKIRPTKSASASKHHSKSDDQENNKSGNATIESQIPAPPTTTSVLVQLPEIHELGDGFLNMEIGSNCLLTDFLDQEMMCDHEYCYGDDHEEEGGTELEDKIMNNGNYGGNSDADQQLYGLFQHTLLDEMMMEDNISHEQEDITPDIKSLLSLMDLQQDGSWS